MGNAGRSLIEKRNTLQCMQQGYLDVFKECVGQSKMSTVDLPTLPWKDISELLSHQVSRVVNDMDTLMLSDTGLNALTSNESVFFFKDQLTMFKLIRVVLHILNEHTEMTLNDLFSYIKASDDEIRKNVMFLLKQGFLVVVEKD